VIYRDHPVDSKIPPSRWKKPVFCRIEFGWGPWGDLNMARVCDWQFKLKISDGKIISAGSCFQSGPFDEQRRNKITTIDDKSCEVISYTSRMKAYEEKATNSINMEILGSPKTKLTIALTQPAQMTVTKSLEQLAESSDIAFTGPFTAESMMLHRIAFSDNYQTEFEFTDKRRTENTDWYYVRVVQSNGSLAWSSPIWLKPGS
jgi:hypothetical protein